LALEFQLKVVDYHYFKDPALMKNNPWIYVELLSLPYCQNTTDVETTTPSQKV
jgi:hypothetical protein